MRGCKTHKKKGQKDVTVLKKYNKKPKRNIEGQKKREDWLKRSILRKRGAQRGEHEEWLKNGLHMEFPNGRKAAYTPVF